MNEGKKQQKNSENLLFSCSGITGENIGISVRPSVYLTASPYNKMYDIKENSHRQIRKGF